MNSDYLKHAHANLQAIDDGLPSYQHKAHMDMAATLALLSIADSLIHIINRMDAMIGISQGGEMIPPREDEYE